MNETELHRRECVPCKRGEPPISAQRIAELSRSIEPEWRVVEGHHLEREFRFKNFRQALDFVDRIGEIAEAEGHHPDIFLKWGLVRVTLFTHAIGGLHDNDFILAAKIERIPRPTASSAAPR